MSKHAGRILTVALLALAMSAPGRSSYGADDPFAGGYDSPYFQADFVQELSDWTSSLVNPALLYRVNQHHLTFIGGYGWSLGTGDMMGYANIDFIAPIRRHQTLALSYLFTQSSIKKTQIGPGGSIREDDVPTGYLDSWLIGTYAMRTPIPWLIWGLNLKYRFQNQFGTFSAASYPGVDLGVYLNPVDHYRFGDLGLSLTFQDIWPASISWSSDNSQVTATRLRAGARYAVWNDQLIGDVEMVIDNAFVELVKGLGLLSELDYTYWDTTGGGAGLDSVQRQIRLNQAFRFAAHLRYQFIPQLWLKLGWNNNNIPYLGFSLNGMYVFPEWINFMNFDCNVGYSFMEYLLKDNLGGDERGFTFMTRLSTDIGPTREQRESRRLYEKLILAPMDAYNEAMRLYVAGKYWEASFAFGKVLSLFPNFHLNDKASYYLGDCYKALYLNQLARDVFKEAMEEYTTSEMRAKYLYGLECIDYREGKFDDALKNHAFIVNLYPDNDIRPDADYVAGQVHFERKNYNVAEQLLKSIKQKDRPYLYAQFTLAIVNVEQGKEAAAIQNLMNVVSDTTQDVAERLLQDGANLKLGHIYYENGNEFRKAVEAYQRIDPGSSFADEGLLGTAWSWIRVNKPDICLQVVDRLVANYPASSLVPEAFLLRGYALMLLKRYAEAIDALDKCVALCNGTFIGEKELEARKQQFDRFLTEFQPQGQRMKKNALRKPTNKTLEERPELKAEYDKFATQNNEMFAMQLVVKANDRFFKRKDQLLEDANYALAKAKNMMKGLKSQQIMQDQRKKQQDIDREIEKAKKQLEQLGQ